MKTLLCAIAKNENKYINEWINYHLNLGFNHIIIYDNNDIDGETIDINNDSVTIKDFRGKHVVKERHAGYFNGDFSSKDNEIMSVQEEAYNDCYKTYSEDYDWIAFFDIDEFLFIDNNLSVNEFLSQDKFNNADAIQINWKLFGDNNHVVYEDLPILERFTTEAKQLVYEQKFKISRVKTIVKTTKSDTVIKIHYVSVNNGNIVNVEGKPTKAFHSQKINYNGAHLRHYYTKTIDEWIDKKINKVEVSGYDWLNNTNNRLFEFFKYNEKTQEKLNIIKTKLNLNDIPEFLK